MTAQPTGHGPTYHPDSSVPWTWPIDTTVDYDRLRAPRPPVGDDPAMLARIRALLKQRNTVPVVTKAWQDGKR